MSEEWKNPNPDPRKMPGLDERVPKIYAAMDTDLARDNIQHDLPSADLTELEYALPGANGEDF